MHIVKGKTKNFTEYEVYLQINTSKKHWWEKSLRELFTSAKHSASLDILLDHVVEADETSGLLVYQLTDKVGQPIFTNGTDDIVLDNPVKMLLLLPNIRQAFHASGFRPKLSSEYKENLRIVYKGPQQQTVVRAETTSLKEAEVFS